MNLNAPLRIFHILAQHQVPFLIIGGHAVNFHGYIRTTEDCDMIYLHDHKAEQQLFQKKLILDGLNFIILDWLIKIKAASGRPRDLDDIKHLKDLDADA